MYNYIIYFNGTFHSIKIGKSVSVAKKIEILQKVKCGDE